MSVKVFNIYIYFFFIVRVMNESTRDEFIFSLFICIVHIKFVTKYLSTVTQR